MKEKKELEKIKKETADKLRDESSSNLKKTILNANRDINEELIADTNNVVNKLNNELSKNKHLLESENNLDDGGITPIYVDSETGRDMNSNVENNYKLKIDKHDKPNIELNVQNLNEDPDKLDLDILDLKTEISDDSELYLDIEELK